MKDKIKAFSIHLLLSVILVLICLFLVFIVWYPSPLIQATGVGKLFLMMLGIDLILGPLLTFIIYKKDKKSIKFDLCIIALIQISALGYGMYSMYKGRPVVFAYTVDRFELIRANDVIYDKGEYDFSYFGPKYIFIDLETGTTESKLDMMLTETLGNISPAQQIKYYKPFVGAKDLLQKRSKPVSELSLYNTSTEIQKFLNDYPTTARWVPLQANAVDMVVLLDQDMQVVKIVDLRPWK